MAVNEINGCFHCNMLFSEPPRKNTAWFTGWVVVDEVKDHVLVLKYLSGSEIFYAFVAQGNPSMCFMATYGCWSEAKGLYVPYICLHSSANLIFICSTAPQGFGELGDSL